MPPAPPRVRAHGQVARVEADEPMGGPQRIGRAARPGVGCRIVHEPRPHRAPSQVAAGSEGLQVVFDHAAAVPALSEVAGTAAGPVEGQSGLGHEPAEGAAEGV